MKKRSKNKKQQTFDVYPHLPQYQYTNGIPRARHAGEFYTYDDYLTHTLPVAAPGDEIEVKSTYNLNSKFPNYLKEGHPNFSSQATIGNTALGGLFGIANAASDLGKTYKTAKEEGSWNINPATGKPYTKADFMKGTITNTTNQNVIIDTENLENMFDDQGNLIPGMNTADNLFMTQNEAKAGYFNKLSDYIEETYIDEDEFLADGVTRNPNFGKPLLSKQNMNLDGSINYAPIVTTTPNPAFNPALDEDPVTNPKYLSRDFTGSDFTEGDLAEINLRGTGAERFKTEKGDVVSYSTTEVKDDKEETVWHEYDKSNYRPGGSFPRNNLQAFANGGQLPKFQKGKEVKFQDLWDFNPNSEWNQSGGYDKRMSVGNNFMDPLYRFVTIPGKPKEGVTWDDIQNWKSERGYSFYDLYKFFEMTQSDIPQDIDIMNRSSWEGMGYGQKDEYLGTNSSGDPYFSWYPQDFTQAYGMANDLGLTGFFYEGQPKLVYSKEEKEKDEALTIASDKLTTFYKDLITKMSYEPSEDASDPHSNNPFPKSGDLQTYIDNYIKENFKEGSREAIYLNNYKDKVGDDFFSGIVNEWETFNKGCSAGVKGCEGPPTVYHSEHIPEITTYSDGSLNTGSIFDNYQSTNIYNTLKLDPIVDDYTSSFYDDDNRPLVGGQDYMDNYYALRLHEVYDQNLTMPPDPCTSNGGWYRLVNGKYECTYGAVIDVPRGAGGYKLSQREIDQRWQNYEDREAKQNLANHYKFNTNFSLGLPNATQNWSNYDRLVDANISYNDMNQYLNATTPSLNSAVYNGLMFSGMGAAYQLPLKFGNFIKSGLTAGDLLNVGFATDAVINKFPAAYNDFSEGNFLGGVGNTLEGLLYSSGIGSTFKRFNRTLPTKYQLPNFNITPTNIPQFQTQYPNLGSRFNINAVNPASNPTAFQYNQYLNRNKLQSALNYSTQLPRFSLNPFAGNKWWQRGETQFGINKGFNQLEKNYFQNYKPYQTNTVPTIKREGGSLPKAENGGCPCNDGTNHIDCCQVSKEFIDDVNTQINAGHYVEPTHNTTEGVPYGASSVASKTVNTAISKSDGDDETSYADDFVENFNISNAAGANKVMADRTWIGNLFNKSSVIPANINKKRHIKNIAKKYGMSVDELLASGEWQLGPDGTIINTPHTSSGWAHSATRGDDMTYNETFGTFTEPNAANNWQGGFSTSITGDKNVEYYDDDVNKYWENIGQYSTGDDALYSNPDHAGSFLEEIVVKPKRFGGDLPKAQIYNSEVTDEPTGTGYEFGIYAPVIRTGGRCFYEGCSNRFYDSEHDLSLGLGYTMGTTSSGDYTGSIRGTGGWEWNPSMGTGGLKTYVGGNAGIRGILENYNKGEPIDSDNISGNTFANLMASIGYTGEFGDGTTYEDYLRGNRGDPPQYGINAYLKKNMLANDYTGGISGHVDVPFLGNLNVDYGYNTNYGPSLMFGLTRDLYKKEGGSVLPKAQTGFLKSKTTNKFVWQIDGEEVTKQAYDDMIALREQQDIDAGKFNIFKTHLPVIPGDINADATTPDFSSMQALANVNPLENAIAGFDPDVGEIGTYEDYVLDHEASQAKMSGQDLIDFGDPLSREDWSEFNFANSPAGAPIETSWGDTPFLEGLNKLNAFTNTGDFGEARQIYENVLSTGTKMAEGANQVINAGVTKADKMIADQEIGTAMTVNPIIESLQSDKGDFDLIAGDYRVNTLGYGDGPRGQAVSQIGQEVGAPISPPDYAYLQQFLNNMVIGYNPEFLMMQANKGLETMVQRKNGGQVIDADMNLIKQLMVAGADFEML